MQQRVNAFVTRLTVCSPERLLDPADKRRESVSRILLSFRRSLFLRLQTLPESSDAGGGSGLGRERKRGPETDLLREVQSSQPENRSQFRQSLEERLFRSRLLRR